MKRTIVHIADTHIAKESGMGRVAWHWRTEFERRGYEFIHIGSTEVGPVKHSSLFPSAAFKFYKNLGVRPEFFLIHEPVAHAFLGDSAPTMMFSHGVERRGWDIQLAMQSYPNGRVSLKTRILYPLWRLSKSDAALRKANRLLLINHEDAAFVQARFGRRSEDIFVFKNGVDPYPSTLKSHENDPLVVLFLGTWLARKGVATLIEAAKLLADRGVRVKWVLAGTGVDSDVIRELWPVHNNLVLEIVTKFAPSEEAGILHNADLFVLPSHFEGQPLALLQAMAAGCCCVTTDCCGQKDLIKDRYYGLLHHPGDSVKLASLIEEAALDISLRTKLGENAKESVAERNWSNVSSEVADDVEAYMSRSRLRP